MVPDEMNSDNSDIIDGKDVKMSIEEGCVLFWCRELYYMSRDVRKPDFCICENKDADKLRGDREDDQGLCFCHLDSTVPLLSKSKFQVSSHLLWLYSPVCLGPDRKPRRPVFWRHSSYVIKILWLSRLPTSIISCAAVHIYQLSFS